MKAQTPTSLGPLAPVLLGQDGPQIGEENQVHGDQVYCAQWVG